MIRGERPAQLSLKWKAYVFTAAGKIPLRGHFRCQGSFDCVAAPRREAATLGDTTLSCCRTGSAASTILGWNSVPAIRVAMAISSLCPAKTFTCRA